jgi:hypothetical protein
MQLSVIRGRVSERLAEGTTPTFYPGPEIDASINEANRLFCLLTLGLEVTASWTVPAATPFTCIFSLFPDLIAVLRITDSTGTKIRPATIADLNALDPNWISSSGAPTRYTWQGVDMIAVYPQPASIVTLQVTYARAPVPLVADTDVPEIPAEYHGLFVGYGVYRCRCVEGSQEAAKAMPYLASFMDGAKRYADFMLKRNLGARYDKVPFELGRYDRSKMLAFGAPEVAA